MNGRLESEIRIQNKTEKRLINVPDFVYGWYLNLKASRKTSSTCYDFVKKICNFLEFINTDISNVTIDDITERKVAEYLLSIQTKEVDGELKPTSDSYQGCVWSCLNNFFEYLVNRNMIEKNYILMIDRPKNRDLERINSHRVLLTEDDFKNILTRVDDNMNLCERNRDRAIMLVFMTTGMRKTALINIMCDDLDVKNSTLFVIDKGNKRHTYTLNEQVLSAIHEWLDVRGKYANKTGDNHLFLSNRGKMIGATALDNLVQKYTKAAMGKPLSPHKLRAGYCSILYDKTHDAEFVRRAVGHANVATTQRYIVTKGNERKKAAEIMASIL